MRITLRQLSVFEAIARTGSIVKASDDICLSPSATSMSLKDLEGHLDGELFARVGKRLLLNERGRVVREMAKSILLQAGELETLTTLDNLKGRLRIAATAPIGAYILPDLCAEFMLRNPEVVLDLTVAPSIEIMSGVQKMCVDVGFVGAPVNSNYLDSEPWLSDRLVICCAPDNLLADAGSVALSRLKDEPWVLEKALSAERTSFTMETLKCFATLNVALEADDIVAIKRTIRSGRFIACLSYVSVRDEIERGELREINVPELQFSRIFSMITRSGVYRSKVQAAFIEFCNERGKTYESSRARAWDENGTGAAPCVPGEFLTPQRRAAQPILAIVPPAGSGVGQQGQLSQLSVANEAPPLRAPRRGA